MNHPAAQSSAALPPVARSAAARSSVARAALAAASVFALAGCGLTGTTSAAGNDQSDALSPTAASGLGDSVKDAGDLPDPCTLLSKAQVTDLTGRKITQIDEDGGKSGDIARYCQWQQENGQLAVFLSRSTKDDFTLKIEDAKPVDGVGQDAFELAGHLYVLYGTVAIDVYSRGDSEAENLSEAKQIAKTVIPKI